MVADEGAPETAGGGRTTASVEEPGTTITSSSTPVDQNGGTTLEDAATVDNTASETSSISIASTTVENGSSVRTVPGSSATDQVNKRAFEAESSSTPARATQVAVDAQGRVLQNLPLLEVTTTLEIEFVTDVHVRQGGREMTRGVVGQVVTRTCQTSRLVRKDTLFPQMLTHQ